MSTTERSILLLGGRSVGKSSVLAAIHSESKRIVAGTDLTLDTNNASFFPLKRKKDLLEDVFFVKDNPIQVGGEGTSESEEYSFNIGTVGNSRNKLSLRFIDTVGGRFGKEEYFEEFEIELNKSRAALLVIDTAELIDSHKIRPSERRNDPDTTNRLFERWLQNKNNTEEPRLICIVPTKTEKWLRERENWDSENGGKEIFRAFEDQYSTFLKNVKSYNSVALTYTPVQTAGNLIFDEFKDLGNKVYPDQLYLKITGKETQFQRERGYAPAYCDQPLRIILNFFLVQQRKLEQEKAYNNVPWWAKNAANFMGLSKWLKEATNTYYDTFTGYEFKQAVEKFGDGIIKSEPFRILGGEEFIKI